jgi:hypothetical protein
VASAPIAETIVHAGEATVEPAGVKSAAMEPAGMKSTGMKSTAVEPAATVASTSATRIGEFWLAE